MPPLLRTYRYTKPALDLTPGRLEVKMQAISDRLDPAATVSTLKGFVVESGSAAVHEA